MKKSSSLRSGLGLLLLAIFSAGGAHAASISVDCSKKSLSTEIAKLDLTQTNRVTLVGACQGNIFLPQGGDLTLEGSAGASIAALAIDKEVVAVQSGRLALKGVALVGGGNGVLLCNNRSVCSLESVTITGTGSYCVGAQDNSAIDLLGASRISGCDTGLGVFGASVVNVRPGGAWNVPSALLQTVIENNASFGAIVQDGSFLRLDGALIANNGTGIRAMRNATLKFYQMSDEVSAIGAVANNLGDGVDVTFSSIADIGVPITGNGSAGLTVGPLSFVQTRGFDLSGNGTGLICRHATSVVRGSSTCQ